MYFTSLEAENFLSIGSLKMDLTKRGLLVVVGENLDDPSAASNGSGKSALIEAIYWCLYGSTLRGIKYVDSVVNRTAKKNCRVSVVLQVKSGQLRVERFRKHKTGKNSVQVFLNGEGKHATDPRVTQRTLNTLLGMDSETFARLVLIGQGFTQRFTDMSDRELKEFIEGLTGSILYAKAHSVAKDALTDIQKQKVGFDESRSALNLNAESLRTQIREEGERVHTAEIERDTKVAEFRSANEQNQLTVDDIQANADQTKSEKEANVAQYDSQIADWQTHIDSLKASRQGVISQQDEWRASHRQTEQEALSEVDAAINALRKQHSDADGQLEANRASLIQARDAEVQSASQARESLLAQQATTRKPQDDEYEALRREVDDFRLPGVDPNLHAALATARAKNEALDKRIADAQAQVGTNCPTCGQEVTDQSVHQHIRETFDPDAERNEIVHGAAGIIACEKAVEEADNQASVETQRQEDTRALLQGKYVELQRLTTEHQAQVSQYDADAASIPAKHEEGIKAVDVELAGLRGRNLGEIGTEENRRTSVRQSFADTETAKDVEFAGARKEWDDQIQTAETSQNEVRGVQDKYVKETDAVIRQFLDQVTTYERAIANNNTEIAKLGAQDLRVALKTLEGNLQSLTEQIAGIDVNAKEADDTELVYNYLVSAFGLGGIRSYMLDSILSYLNERLRTYCYSLFDGVVNVELSPIFEQQNKSVVEKISLVVTTHGGSYDASSGGERRKIDVALFLAFRDLNRSMNPVQVNVEAYDEILSFLDGESASRVIQLLVADQSVETKILITHRSDVPIIGPHQVIKAVKQFGVTSYVMPTVAA